MFVIKKKKKPVVRLDRDSGRNATMGLQQIVLVVSIRHHVKAEQMREMPTGRSSPPPPKIMASLKSQNLAQKVSATTIQAMRKLQQEKHCDGLKPGLS